MGLDCHDTGIITVAQQLREGGFEVIYLGLHNSADQVAKAALEEDADLIGVSFLSGQHITQVRKLFDSLRARQLEIPVVCGGVIPDDDAKELLGMGVREVIRPGALTEDVLARVRRALA